MSDDVVVVDDDDRHSQLLYTNLIIINLIIKKLEHFFIFSTFETLIFVCLTELDYLSMTVDAA